MKTMLQSPSMRFSIARLKNRFATNDMGTRWLLSDAGVRPLGVAAQRDVLLVPTEHVLLLAVALPLPTRRKRIEALPFAIEDRIASRPEAVLMALGEAIGDGMHLACVVDHAQMSAWVAAADAVDLGDAAIMPDALALPIPPQGRWNVHRPIGRVVVRTPDGAGFATSAASFAALHAAAGRPGLDECDALDAGGIVLDLRQQGYARPRQAYSSVVRRAAFVAAAGLAAHGAIAAVDTAVLQSSAAQRGEEMTRLLAQVAPGAYSGSDPQEAAMIAADLLPAGGVSVPGRMIPLLVRASQAITPFGGTVAVRAIRYDEADMSLGFELDTADREAAPALVDAVRAAGLSARLDGAILTVGHGKAGR